MRNTIYVFILLLILLFSPKSVFAADYEIICDTESCTPTIISSLFPSSELWYPGKSVIKTVNIINNSGTLRYIKIRPVNINSSGHLEEKLDLTIKSDKTSHIWSGTLKSFFQESELKISDLADGASEEFSMDVLMHEAADNDYQGKSVSFNMIFSISDSGAASPTPTSTPVPAATNTPTPVPSSESSDNSTAATPTPTTVQLNYFSGFTIPSETPAPTGEVLGQQSETAPVVTSGASCRNPWWGFLVVLLQGIITAYLVRRVQHEILAQAVMVNIIATLTAILIFSFFFCFRWLIEIPLMLNLLTLFLIYRKLHSPLLNLSSFRTYAI